MQVIVKKLALVVEGRPDVVLDLTQNLAEIKRRTFNVKEGILYQIRIEFFVQREIVTGLKYVQKITRLGAPGTSISLATNTSSRNVTPHLCLHPTLLLIIIRSTNICHLVRRTFC